MAIKKAVFQYVVMFDDAEFHADQIYRLSAQDVQEECYDGNMLGAWSVASVDIVPDSELQKEMEDLGNDGTFFDLFNEDDDT
jgi:hypothetical protein